MDARARLRALIVVMVVVSTSHGALGESDPLPPDFPQIEATVSGNPAPGHIFLSSFSQSDPSAPSYLLILENDGTPVFHRRLPPRAHDFKLQPDGRLTYFDPVSEGFYALDSTYTVVDSFHCGNGLTTDFHDLLVLPNGHALLMSYETRIMDMTPYHPRGHPDAEVIGLAIQEIDRAKNVVFEWKSWDHFEITDAIGIPLGARRVDYVHGNSLDVDQDGNIILSSRSLNEVTKISRATGEVIWRLGGLKNQFRFLDGATEFSRQHFARMVDANRLLLYDNGTFRSPPYSRAVEYEIDEARRTVRQVWEYRHTPDIFGPFSGSAQRLPNGNTLVGWGTTVPTLTEVDARGNVVHELTFDPGIFSYRAYRFDWPPMEYANVSVVPSTLHLTVATGWIHGVIEPVGFEVASIDVSTVRLAGSIPAEMKGVAAGDADGNGKADLMVTFARAPLQPLLTTATTQLEISGALDGGKRFHGFAPVRVIAPMGAPRPSPALRLTSVLGAVPVELTLEGGGTIAVHDVHGRLVTRWSLPASRETHRITWDGRHSDGTRAASGIYYARHTGPDGIRSTKRIVIAR